MIRINAITQAAYVCPQLAADRAAILWLTGMSAAELRQMITDTGTLWLAQHSGMATADVADILLMPAMWQWWDGAWRRTDHYQVLPYLYHVPPAERRATYRGLHQQVFMQQSPGYALVRSGYEKALEKCLSEA